MITISKGPSPLETKITLEYKGVVIDLTDAMLIKEYHLDVNGQTGTMLTLVVYADAGGGAGVQFAPWVPVEDKKPEPKLEGAYPKWMPPKDLVNRHSAGS